MPIHDWSRVDAGILYDFHHAWIEQLKRLLNTGVEEYKAPSAKPLTLAAYEAEMGVRAFVEPVAVGDALPEMPLFLKPGGHVTIAIESTYESAWEAVPLRWRKVVEG